jgi:hypothetical protein
MIQERYIGIASTRYRSGPHIPNEHRSAPPKIHPINFGKVRSLDFRGQVLRFFRTIGRAEQNCLSIYIKKTCTIHTLCVGWKKSGLLEEAGSRTELYTAKRGHQRRDRGKPIQHLPLTERANRLNLYIHDVLRRLSIPNSF